MDKTQFLTIFGTFENLDVVRQTLPSIIAETRRNDARLIVHDSSITGRGEKWDYLLELNKDHDFHLILSDNMSMAHVRNMCLQLGQELYAPDYICMVEDDHGFHKGLIPAQIQAMREYYGKPAPNGLRYGLFTGCAAHHNAQTHRLANGNAYPDAAAIPIRLGGANSCFRCAPTQHWQNVLKGYDTDEYLISVYQTVNLNYRNYHKGFTTMIVQDGRLVFNVDATGRGFTDPDALRLWDENYTASDARSVYRDKPSRQSAALQDAGPTDPAVLLALGEQRFREGDHAGAHGAFTAVLQRLPDHPDALNNLAVLAWESGDAPQAVEYLERTLAVAPLHRDATLNGSRILHALGNPQDAHHLCARYLDSHPDDAEVRALQQQI